jgi:hypothetical protein
VYGEGLEFGKREFYCNHEEPREHCEDLDNWCLDDERDENRGTGGRSGTALNELEQYRGRSRGQHALHSPRVTQSPTDEVPEELAIDETKEAGPHGVYYSPGQRCTRRGEKGLTNARCDGNQARILVPDEFSHGGGSDGRSKMRLSSALVANTAKLAKTCFGLSEEERTLKE